LGKTDDRGIFKKLFEEGISQQVIKGLPLSMLFALARDHTLGFAILDGTLIAQLVEACWDGIKR
jgi:TetR/AcrR family transcriptional regulator, repressor of fatR-cypB operon